jgi:hypothetical protein
LTIISTYFQSAWNDDLPTPMNANPIIRVEHLHKWFGLLHILKDISFTVQLREVLVIIAQRFRKEHALALSELSGRAFRRYHCCRQICNLWAGISPDRNQI